MLVTLFLINVIASSQHPVRIITLEEVIRMAGEQSIAALKARTQKETSYWKYKSYQSNYKPQLQITGTVPDFNRTFSETVQPDGSILFQPVTYSNTQTSLSLSQAISPTGGTFFLRSSLQRYDDFEYDYTYYNAFPVQVGLLQPILKFNAYKWEKIIEPLKFEESLKTYFEDIEEIGLMSVQLFFQLLHAQVNKEIAETNLQNNQQILDIARERYNLGKSSRNDVLQLHLALLNAQKQWARAKAELETADLHLKSYIGYTGEESFIVTIPETIPRIDIDAQVALENALANRPDPVSFERRKKEAEEFVARARGENGFNADLVASFGLSNTAPLPGEVYRNPRDQESVFISLVIPVLDWGRSKSRMETAMANQRLVEYTIEQDRINFNQEVMTEVEQLMFFYEQLDYNKQADSIASERYRIALEKYMLGAMSITDFIIASDEKDAARMDYIMALDDFWTSYRKLRLLTLYDFEFNRKIQY